jgi:hypothetical protein
LVKQRVLQCSDRVRHNARHMLPIDEQDRIIAGLVPAALDGAEREVIKTAYAMATVWRPGYSFELLVV